MTATATAGDSDAVVVGSEIPSFVVEQVSADHIKIVALLLRDSNPIHFDLDAVAAAGLGTREVNQGGSTLAYVYDMLIAWSGSRSAVVAVSCQFRGNVFAGDRVVCGGTVTAVRDTGDILEVDCEVWADTGAGVRAIKGVATVRLPRHTA